MKWIEYQVLCNENKLIFINKKIEYTEANIAIAENEAYNGQYFITEDERKIERKPLEIEFGGTGAKSANDALVKLGAVSKLEFNQVSKVSERRINALFELNKGVTYQFEKDETEGYFKPVLSGARLASVNRIDGMGKPVEKEVIGHARITEINRVRGNLFRPFNIEPVTINGITMQYLPDEDCFVFNGSLSKDEYAEFYAPYHITTEYRRTLEVGAFYVSGTFNSNGEAGASVWIDDDFHEDGGITGFYADLPTESYSVESGSNLGPSHGEFEVSFSFYCGEWPEFSMLELDNYKVRVHFIYGDERRPKYEYVGAYNDGLVSFVMPKAVQDLEDYGVGVPECTITDDGGDVVLDAVSNYLERRDNGDWYYIHNAVEEIFDGSEDEEWYETKIGTQECFAIKFTKPYAYDDNRCYSSYYGEVIAQIRIRDGEIGCTVRDNREFIVYCGSPKITLEQFKDMLSRKPLQVLYTCTSKETNISAAGILNTGIEFDVKEDDILNFHSDFCLPVHSEVEYAVKLSEV